MNDVAGILTLLAVEPAILPPAPAHADGDHMEHGQRDEIHPCLRTWCASSVGTPSQRPRCCFATTVERLDSKLLAVPGTSSIAQLEENLRALTVVELAAERLSELGG
ncbi:hypothetical protein [Nonomuraea sp. NPDC005650]|uniref:hypothetical protein n=1 Tax=Nonomuraea sp. NPDC005650 TaxID=3157045 RepID=UPI0033B8DDC0